MPLEGFLGGDCLWGVLVILGVRQKNFRLMGIKILVISLYFRENPRWPGKMPNNLKRLQTSKR